MRGDTSWVPGIYETAKMPSIPGLPTPGSDITILITRVHVHPLCVLVEFWGKFSQDRTADYERLAKDIQSCGDTFQEFEGNPGDQCLVQIDGSWYRSRIVSRNGSKYIVFLFDKGRTCNATTSHLAWGKKEYFNLPPEVEFCVLANVLPVSTENRWSAVALEFLESLSGKSVKAYVQDVVVQHRTFLMHIPCISKQMYEMGIAKKLSPDLFQNFVFMSLQSNSGAQVSPQTLLSLGAGDGLHKKEPFLYPELPTGTVETVLVTEVTNPQRIFCQLNVFSQELKKLSKQITQCCEGRTTSCTVGPENIGYPCAARGSDGQWYRSVLQQVCPTSNLAEVLNVDYGTKQFVQLQNVRPLAAEFFRMPVVTYICSLHGVIDKRVGWTTSQIDYLRSLLLHKIVIAKFEYQSISEGVHYVTLYGAENTNINNLFGSKESEDEKTLGDYAIGSTSYSQKHPAVQGNQRKMLTPGQEKEKRGIVEKLPAEDLALKSSHVAVVQHVTDPSEFWIQTQNHANELDELMDSLYHLYKDAVNKDVVRNPTVGLYCAAKSEDGDFYRATVAEVGESQIKVFFVDYGNTEVVDRHNIRTLPDQLKKLPCLSLKCTLAGVRPKDGRWSRSASEFFNKAVSKKELTVHVTAKYDDGYAVRLTDPKAQGERDVSTLMCSSGLAERAETQGQPKAKLNMQPAILPQFPDARLSGVYRNKGMSSETSLNTVCTVSNERRIPAFKEHMFPTGSVLDVSVSYIESPNDFWCQLAQNAGHLKLLMHDIQAHYAGSEFQPFVESACIARHPDNGMWYRALVIHKHETPDVDVLFVDYGQTETVSLYHLRRINPQFLTLHGQAFRCSLLNPIDPTSAINEWNEEAVEKFHRFVETAASNFVILKCTIYAVMYSEQKILFNVVDLETPFESVCTSMVNVVKGAPPKKAAGPSFRMDSYYYSMHNIKTGTEEQVTVTCVNNVSQFYCHLERNADVIKDLSAKVKKLCHQLENAKLPTVFGTLCFAKYTDGLWYRGQIKATKPAVLVHFVDYGDTIEVEESDLLPVPREANDIMSVPVQAVVCSLSDVPASVPSEANRWFETSATECKFRALIVAREPDGKLQVELYHGNTQVNSKIKKMFRIEMPREDVVHQGQKAPEASANNAQKTQKFAPKHTAEIHKPVSAPKPAHQMRNANMNPKPSHSVRENGQKLKSAPLELYVPPHQRQSCRTTPSNTENGSEPTGATRATGIKPRNDSPPTETDQLKKSKSPETESKSKNAEKLPKLADLPSQSITSGMEADVYVSHYNSPLSFYVQLVREENEIFSLVEKLNDSQFTPQANTIKDVHPGDLVQAEFEDDSSWYRAVVRELHSKTLALVEFVDFGNTAVMPISKLCRLRKSFLQLPMYSMHCALSEAAGLGKEEVIDPEVLSAVKDNVSDIGDKVFKCQFIRQSGSVWEVRLEHSGVNVTCKVPTRCSTDGSEITSEKLELVEEKPTVISDIRAMPKISCSLCYHQQEFLVGQNLEVYITTINDAWTFWCQPADAEELDKITASVSEVGDAANHKPPDPGSLSPGSPCVALFSDDSLWYRAEVINKDGDELSVLFVDYGNRSQVNIADVKEISPDLMETPPQAFLCELEGFDASRGSWDSAAVDELSALTAEKLLQLTVTRVTRAEGKMKCFVLLECEGLVINEALKTWWKCSSAETKPGPLQCDSTGEETAPSEDQPEYPEGQDMDAADACIDPQRAQHEEQNTGELIDINEEVMPCDSGTDETMLSPPKNKDDHNTLTLSCDESAARNDTKEEGFPVNDVDELDDLKSPLDENLTEVMDELEIKLTDLECLPGEHQTSSTEISSDMKNLSAEEGDDSEVTFAREGSRPNMTTVKMVSREAFHPREKRVDQLEIHNICKEVQTELVLPSCVLPTIDAPTEQGMDTGDGFLREELPCVPTHVESDSMTGEQTTAHKDEYSAVLADSDSDTAAMEPQASTEPSQQEGDRTEEESCSVEEEEKEEDEAVTSSFQEEEDEPSCSVEEDEEAVTCSFEEDEEEQSCSVEDQDTSASCSVEEDEEAVTCSFEKDKEELSYSVQEEEEVTSCTVEEEEAVICSAGEEEAVIYSVEEEEACSAEEEEAVIYSVEEEEEAVTCSAEEEEAVTCSAEEEEAVTCPFEEQVICSAEEEEAAICSIEEEVTCSAEEEEACLTDVFTGLNEPRGDSEATSATEDCLSNATVEEMIHSEDDTSSLQEDERFALPAHTEPPAFTVCSPDLNLLVEEVTCLVRDICLADVCRDDRLDEQQPANCDLVPHEETEGEEMEQLVHPPPSPEQDFSISVLEKEASSSADDSFEAQLSKITHLSLIIHDCSDDIELVEQQPEE